jgi:hypothetical protein
VRRQLVNIVFENEYGKKPKDGCLELVKEWLGVDPAVWAKKLVADFKRKWLPQEDEWQERSPEDIYNQFAPFIHLDEIVLLAAADFSIPANLRIFHAENSQLLPASVNTSKNAKYYEQDFMDLVYPGHKEWRPTCLTDTLTIDGEKIERGERRREPIAIVRPRTVEKSLPFPSDNQLKFDKLKWFEWVLAQQKAPCAVLI